MNDIDLDRLGDVWRQQPDPAELAELQRAAEAARRRARWAQLADIVAAIVVAAVVAILVLRNPAIDTLVIGGGAILILLISNLRQRKLRAAELRSLTGTTEQMLDQSIERVQATLKRVRSGFIVALPGIALGLLVAYVVEQRSGGELSSRVAAYPGLDTAIQVAAAFAVVAMVIHMLRLSRSARRELQRLQALRDSYRQEQESSSGEETTQEDSR